MQKKKRKKDSKDSKEKREVNDFFYKSRPDVRGKDHETGIHDAGLTVAQQYFDFR